jgi:hypothetical protein
LMLWFFYFSCHVLDSVKFHFFAFIFSILTV